MKKLINSPDSVVDEALSGLAHAHRDLVRADLDFRLCVRADAPVAGKVALLSGGGSGHEPLHAGFVGPGMLDVAVLGDIFASPNSDQVLAAARTVDSGAGVLFIVKNYTGDVLNFRLGAELAEDEGIDVEIVVVDDDVAVPDREGSPGRRGTGATVFVEKIAGALAANGGNLKEVAEAARRVVDGSRSIGIALQPCTTPMAGRPTFELGADEVEFGVGIHGEAGLRRQQMRPAAELVSELVRSILDDLRPERGTDLLLLTNSLGGTPDSELYIVHREATRILREQGVTVARSLVGRFVTSLDMVGVSLSALALDNDLSQLWDAPVRTPAWTKG